MDSSIIDRLQRLMADIESPSGVSSTGATRPSTSTPATTPGPSATPSSGKKDENEGKEETKISIPVVHPGYKCDGAKCAAKGDDKSIVGPRFHCLVCDDIDLCIDCRCDPANGHPADHTLDEITKPVSLGDIFDLSALRSLSSDSSSSNGGEGNSRHQELVSRRRASHPAKDGDDDSDDDENSHESKIEQVRWGCNSAEEKLLDRVIDLSHVPKGYTHMHVDDSVIKSLERITHLALVRRQQFEHGILRGNQITGAVLYGPPGTGKTLLAQAVARHCSFSMLSISPGDIFQREWGEDEKVIRAAFSLGRKLHPCILFIDEADGIFSARQSDDKKYIRGMMSEFLAEWDGASCGEDRMHNPLVLLATNRPWDMDQAVLRRAPVRILLDVPTPSQREGILGVILKDETIGDDFSVAELSRLTRLYTGSDLKNLCVSAALICVDEQEPDPKTGKYPTTRVLCRRHFTQALREVKPTTPNRLLARQLREFQKRGS